MPALDRAVLSPTGCNLVAFSGGPDSLLLLGLLLDQVPEARLRVVHIDHSRDPDSPQRAEQACGLARTLGVEAEVHTLAADPPETGGPEAAMREARYALLSTLMSPGDHVLTGHHADDQAETILLRLLRGAGPRGLAGMPALRPLGSGQLGRPLLAWTRAEIEAELARRRLRPVVDPGNSDLSLDRNYLRHAVLPDIEQRWPAWRNRLNVAARQQRWAAHRLHHALNETLESLLVTQGRETCLDQRGWQGCADDEALALLRHWLEQQGLSTPPVECQREFLRQCRDAALDRQPRLALAQGSLRAWQQRIWLDPNPEVQRNGLRDWIPIRPFDVAAGGQLRLLGAGRPPAGHWQVGPPPAGAMLRLAANRPRSGVRELLRRIGLPPWRRGAVPALFIDQQLVALGGTVLDHGFAEQLQQAGLAMQWHNCPPQMSALLSLPSNHQNPRA